MQRMSKTKGTRAERELLHRFWDNGFTAMRAPASGAIKYPCPDLLVGNVARKMAIECKSTSKTKQYLTGKEVRELQKFSSVFGAEPWIAVRFDMTSRKNEKEDWFFFMLEDLDITEGNNYVVSLGAARRKGLLFEEVVK
jgi:holliday junction resolvase Hjr